MDSNYASNFNGPFNPTSAEPAPCRVVNENVCRKVDDIDKKVEPAENKIKMMQSIVDNINDSLFPIMDILGAPPEACDQLPSVTNMMNDLDLLRERLSLIARDMVIIKRYIMG